MLNELGLSGLPGDVGSALAIAVWLFALVTVVLWLAVPFILLGIRARLARLIELQMQSLTMGERFIAGFHAANQLRGPATAASGAIAPVAVAEPPARLPGETESDYQHRLNGYRA